MQDNIASYTYKVTKENITLHSSSPDKQIKASDYLRRVYNYSSRLLKTIKYDGTFCINDKQCFLNTPVKDGDIIKLTLKPEGADCEANNIYVEVLFEDEDMLIANKPPYMLTHPSKNIKNNTLANALYYRWQTEGVNIKAHFVGRLDMNTSGIVCVAKNKYAHHYLQDYLEKNSHCKYYLAIVQGKPNCDKGVIKLPIGYSGDGLRRAVGEDKDEAKECISEYEIIASNGEYSLLKLCLVTGRTHQLRVHLAYIGCPILSDELYSKKSELIARQALHAYELTVPNINKNTLMRFRAPLNDDMDELVKKLFKKENLCLTSDNSSDIISTNIMRLNVEE